jgi:lysophospholipase L1-like esterase
VIVSARVGAPSSEILDTWSRDKKVQNANWAVVSAGSNDIAAQYSTSQTPAKQQELKATLEKIRKVLNAKKYIWILPNFSIANRVVADFAQAHGDQTVSFKVSGDNVHPANYNTVAKDVLSIINS